MSRRVCRSSFVVRHSSRVACALPRGSARLSSDHTAARRTHDAASTYRAPPPRYPNRRRKRPRIRPIRANGHERAHPNETIDENDARVGRIEETSELQPRKRTPRNRSVEMSRRIAPTGAALTSIGISDRPGAALMNHPGTTRARLLQYARLLCIAAGTSLAGAIASAPASATSASSMSSAPTATSASAPAAPSRGASPKPGSAASALASPASAASAPSPVSNAPAPRTLTVPPLPPLTEAESADVTRRALALRAAFAQDVARRLNVPDAEQRAYGERLQQTLDANGLGELAREYVVLVDRAPNVQAVFLYFRTTRSNAWQMIGASPVATGLPGQYDHFVTPLGVFEHTPENMDFRAEGTTNDNGIRGYGQRDMRIYDFGWTDAERGWGKGGVSQMRFQMHATDPEYLEPLLGIRHSKGCVRIPASLNVFLDQHGILDAEYEARAAGGDPPWVLRAHRQVTPWAGRYLVVIDSQRKTRPAWSPAPGKKAQAKLPKGGDTAD
ncbi:hypothetical protein [Burkholderia pseudomallei]|uniref:hypothetical protein n=1 Tax=Burkholderia pseudomallei TaxID=28450 RepID=UPI0021806BEC|nr:hypothetical protein [Burkholderia pseudomallei]